MNAESPTTGVPKVRVARRRGDDLRYRMNRAALHAIMLSYVPLILVSVIGMIYGACVGTAYLWEYRASHPFIAGRLLLFMIAVDFFVLIAGFFLLFGLLPLFFRTLSPPSGGKPLHPQHHPRLVALVERIAKRLGTRPPETYLLSPFDKAAIADLDYHDESGHLTRNHRTLLLGAAFVVHTNINEFTTILCHELAHAATGDTRMTKLTIRFFQSLATQVSFHADDESGDSDQERGWLTVLMYWLLYGYLHLFALFYCVDSRYRELRADRIAAEICGPQNVRDALIKTHLVGFLPQLSIEKLLTEYSESDRDIDNVYAEHRRRWHELPPSEREQAENAMFLDAGSIWDAHPRLADRIRNLADVEAKELSADRPATDLFTGWQAIEADMTNELIAFGRAMHEVYLKALERYSRLG